ncbi:hypothetical protein FEM48_Zijuj01G0050900 [Ziziphus jujuba var. spinosa]|uniref:Reverse transcriptase Ty1/copia-type domain-containing protein n=1 Tax=Ziziphus jujuba var. spinosa TaxID=714518 RepID=A0A978VZA3_ZIZJJ|nr:hypothetical protein FEM48_Zijuj01G0050900 [Ziziphus jujuba var. spinosa]
MELMREEATTPLASPTASLQEAKIQVKGATVYEFTIDISVNFQEAMEDKNWKNAMDEEIKAIKNNETWEPVLLPQGSKASGMRWVYKAKKNAKGEVEMYKVRLLAKKG